MGERALFSRQYTNEYGGVEEVWEEVGVCEICGNPLNGGRNYCTQHRSKCHFKGCEDRVRKGVKYCEEHRFLKKSLSKDKHIKKIEKEAKAEEDYKEEGIYEV